MSPTDNMTKENIMNRGDHIEGLKAHYIEEIQTALRESEHEHGTIVDYGLLNDKILFSWKSAHLEGVDLDTFVDWISDAIPEHVQSLDIVRIKGVA